MPFADVEMFGVEFLIQHDCGLAREIVAPDRDLLSPPE